MKQSKPANKVVSLLLAFLMVISVLPAFSLGALAEEKADSLFAQSSLSVVTDKASTLAPGVKLDTYTVYDKNGDQVEMFVTTVDPGVETVKVYASYLNMDPTNYGMSRLTAQVESFNKKVEAGDEYYKGTVVAGINSSYYNMITGKPTGTFVMNGIDVTNETEGNNYPFYAILKDGTHMIGNKSDYSKYKGQIVEAIGGYHLLMKDGVITPNTWSVTDTKKYPRQTIGVTADGKVIVMTADGNQAPKSIGLTMLEQAQVMLDLGCVDAIHLDGGGSCTYACKPEGSNSFGVANSPSDGSEREISNGLIIASTVVSDGKFAYASLSAENSFVTPGSTVSVSYTGVDAAGGFAEVPADISWQLADPSFGTVEKGVFTSTGKVGVATVQMVYSGKVVGEAVINVVIPDSISFNTPEIVVPYGRSLPLEMTALYGVNKVVLKADDFRFTLSNEKAGTISGFTFTACEEDATVTGSTLTAEFVHDASLNLTASITLGKGSQVVYDFEDGTNQNVYFNETPGTKYNYVWPETTQAVVDKTTGKVRFGDKALMGQIDYSNSLESGYMKSSLYATETRVFENASRVGLWIYISDEAVGLWARWTLSTVTSFAEDGTPTFGSALNGNAMDTTAGGTGIVYTFDEPGWHYLYVDVDTTKYAGIGWKANTAMIQFYISDRDGTAYDYYASEQSNIPSKFTFYIDDITVDYSSAVDDREAPVFSDMTYAVEGMPDAAALNGQTVTSNTVSFAASLADYTGKSNFTGIDESTVKAYIDGVEADCIYASGKVSILDAKLTNGKHTVKFAAYDNMGNYGYIYGTINVNAAETESTVKLVAKDPTATYIKLGSIYEMNLVATAIEEVKSVELMIDLDNNSKWQLDHMTVAEGFTATYGVDATENIATIIINKTGTVTATGEAVLATLPVRVWTLKTGYVYANGTKAGANAMTLKQFRDGKEFWRMSVIAKVEKGLLTRVDDSNSTFSGERVFCDTEMWGNYAKMSATAEGLAYYNAWDGGHLHKTAAIEDKDATCTEKGYTGRTFCEGCSSVVDWGTAVEAKGHQYSLTEGVLQCHCGELFNGEHTDGKTYVNGVVIANGWTEDFKYYLNGVKLTGLNEIDGYYYDFGTEGVCPNKARLDGYYYNEEAKAYMYFLSGKKAVGDTALQNVVHFFDENGYAYSGEKEICGFVCTFDEKGVFLSSADEKVLEAGCIGANLKYVLLNDGSLIIEGEGAMKDYQVSGLYAPWFYSYMDKVNTVYIGKDVTTIGDYAFNRCERLYNIYFEEGSVFEEVGTYAFRACHRLAGISLPATTRRVSDYAFFKCGAMKYFKVAENSVLEYIGREAFAENHYLETMDLPGTVTSIGDRLIIRGNSDVVLNVVEDSFAYHFAKNNGFNYSLVEGVVAPLYKGTLTDSITWELYPNGKLIIAGLGAMPDYSSQNNQPWRSVSHLVKAVSIGKDITAIGNYAFAYCDNLETIEFEAGSALERIGVLAFRSAGKVREVVIPDGVTYVATYAFGTCVSLESVYVPQGVEYIHPKAFVESTKAVLNVAEGTYAEEYAVANGVAHTVRAFEYTAIESGTCGENATWAFYENGTLRISGSGAIADYASHKEQPWAAIRHLVKKIEIGKDITAVGNYAFAYCEYVEAIEFEAGSALERIGILAFRTARKVTEVVIPDSVTYIATYAFGTCVSLESVYVPQGVEYIHPKAFVESTKVVLNVAEGTYAEEYAVANGVAHTVRDFEYIAIQSGTCGENATWEFYENGTLRISGSGAIADYASHKEQPWAAIRHLVKKIEIGKDITVVGNYAFAYCEFVEAIEFEEGSVLERIGILAFRTARKVTEVVIPDSVTYVATYAFGTCVSLESVYIPQGVTYIHPKAFVESTKVVLNVAEGTYAEEYAVANGIDFILRDFVPVAIQSGSCGENATWEFYENGTLKISGSGAMTDYATYKDTPWRTFRHLIKTVVIGKDITSVGNYAFAYCDNIETILFEEGSALTRIGVLAFRSAGKVAEITLPDTVSYIGSFAFANLDSLTSIYIPEGVSFIHADAFNGTPLFA